LINDSDYILSIVPPRDAIATAQRIVDASSKSKNNSRTDPLYFLDLNAVSPKSARTIDDLISKSSPSIKFIDGGIIGGPPSQKDDKTWSRPSIPNSGPHRLDEAKANGKHLAEILNIKHINATIGAASGLKMCFASLSKGFTALAIQSFTTAHNFGVIPELKAHMQEFNPAALKSAENSLVAMCPKAYRWVHEMREIAETFEADGGFEAEESSFRSIAEVYELVANGTELGEEKVGERKLGKTAEDVARVVSEGTARRKVKTE
jgi:3-hydroxyisobutyrate dehydrogenase-like beta-hydroxyacid dehydrogenase